MNLGVLRDVIERHADEASFLWCQRQRGSQSPVFDLTTLADWDDRLDANLEGLLIAGQVGLELCQAGVHKGRAGASFSAAYLAAELGDTMAFAKLAVAAEDSPAAQHEIVAAISWLSPSVAQQVLVEMGDERAPQPLQRLALEAHVLRGSDPGPLLEQAMKAELPSLRRAALSAAGALGRRDQLDRLRKIYRDADDDGALHAACSAVLLGETAAAALLWDALAARAARSGSDDVQPTEDKLRVVTRLAAHCGELDAVDRLSALAEQPATRSLALIGATALGDPACIPFVLQALEQDGALARLAGLAYATITGAELAPPLAERLPMTDPTPAAIARRVAEPVEDLPLPNGPALSDHWQQLRGSLEEGKRYLGGKPYSPDVLFAALRQGNQIARHESATALCIADTRRPLLCVAAPSPMQYAWLASID